MNEQIQPRNQDETMAELYAEWESSEAAQAQAEQVPGQSALLKVNPDNDKVALALYDSGMRLKEYAVSRVIASEADIKAASADLGIISKLKSALETSRKEYTEPLNAHVKSVNAAFKAMAQPIIDADDITRKKILDYQAKQRAKAVEEERINALRLEAAQAEAVLNEGVISQPVNMVEVTAAPQAVHRAADTTLGGTKATKWKVVDFSLVPDEFKVLDDKKINKLVTNGGTIEGIETYTEYGLRVNTAAPVRAPDAPPAELPASGPVDDGDLPF